MSPAISIALLLLSTTVVKSLEDQTEEEEGFPLQLKHDVKERADHRTEEMLQDGAFPGSCDACESVVAKVKQKLGSDHSKKKIGQLLSHACDGVKSEVFKSTCKKINFKKKFIDAIANRGSPRSICVELKLCKRNTPVYR